MTLSDSDVVTDWPLLDELKQWRDVTGSEWDGTGDATRFTRELAAAIAQVKLDVGDWDELVDLPDAALGEAAMRLAVLIRANASTPADSTVGLGSLIPRLTQDPVYQACLRGHHRRFPIA